MWSWVIQHEYLDVTTAESALRLESVSRTFGVTAAVRNVSLDIRRGEIVSLVGHSGCGKSTLLRIISGVESTGSGRVFISGREVDGPNIFLEPEARSIGFVFQDYALFPHLTARENVLFGLKGRSKTDAAQIADEIIDRVGIDHLSNRYPHTLSGGEQQRVALARALAPRPSVVLMDEPFSNLDQGLRDKVRHDTLSLLKSLNTTVILVTHDPQEALSAGDRVVLMRSGEIVQSGSPYDVHDQPSNAYAAEFFCSFNKIPGIYEDGVIQTAIGSFERHLDLPPENPVTVFVRPQNVEISLDGGDTPATVTERTFHGEIEQIVLSVAGSDVPLKVRTMTRIPDGVDTLRVSIRPDNFLVFDTASM
jgi:iron(III) transport system ATP-binding protein